MPYRFTSIAWGLLDMWSNTRGRYSHMKLQYLGDSKDSFKWDYHDYLTDSLGFELLSVLPMMTPDDNSNEGNTKPVLFPARKEIINFCKSLQNNRDITYIKSLPRITGSEYNLLLHKHDTNIKNNRNLYYTDINTNNDQVVFLDPDNGFEPEKTYNEKHVRYREIRNILHQISHKSVISVFQHFRRVKFTNDFNTISKNILNVAPFAHITAIYWNQLMFVLIGKSEKIIIEDIKLTLNKNYSNRRPVKII